MDYQNRVGSKQGGGGVASNEDINMARRQRLRQLFNGTNNILENDPYVHKNHLGYLECKLCLTTHVSETSYVIHVKGKKHITNLKKRQVRLEKQQVQQQQNNMVLGISKITKKKFAKIGFPGYKITKIRDEVTGNLGIQVSLQYSKIAKSDDYIDTKGGDSITTRYKKPMFRIMNYYEQKVETENHDTDEEQSNDKKYQYLVISGEPYENVCIKIPSNPVIRNNDDSVDVDEEGNNGMWEYWDEDVKCYYLQMFFKGI